MRIKHIILLLFIPFTEIKSIFYNSDLKVSWYLFSDHRRYLCNVLEDYANAIIISVVFYYILFVKCDVICKQILFFLFIISILDFLFLLLFDNEYYLLKVIIAPLIYVYGISKVSFQRS